MSRPEDLIQAAWAARARQDIERARQMGFWGKQVTWPVWAPEEAVKALREAGWTPPPCACSEAPSVKEGEAWDNEMFGKPEPLTEKQWAFIQAMEESLKVFDEDDWPEVAS